MQPGTDNALRTRVYIDGCNLYYGCLKNSPDKWLDVRALAECVLSNIPFEQNGEPVRFGFQTPAVKYFTAPILAAFAKSDDSVSCQSLYHTALCAYLDGEIEIIKGYHDAKPARARAWEEGKAARECKMIDIWKLEEKQSDVAFALNAFSDAVRNEVDQVIAVTNDSDFAPAMRMIRQHTRAVVGLIAPARYPRPDLLIPIYEEAKRVRRSEGAARKWLTQPCARLGGRIPIRMCESTEEAGELRKYMDRYAQEFGI